MLLTRFLFLLSLWRPVFAQRRTQARAVRQALGSLLVLGDATLTRILAGLGLDQQDWSADYRLHARSTWDADALFDTLLPSALAHCPGRFVAVARDDTRVKKTGKHVAHAAWQRDPLSPPFHVNLLWGLRVLQASLLLPLHRRHDVSARGVPVRFQLAPHVKKPGKHAPAEQQQDYRRAQQQHNLSHQSVRLLTGWRASLDAAGRAHQTLLAVGDASFANRTLFQAARERTELLCRTRKNTALCGPAVPGTRRKYSPETFTPEVVRQDEAVAWRTTKLRQGGKRRKLRDKELRGVLWRRGARQTPLRRLVVAPTPYRRTKTGKTYYRQAGYVLTTDLTTPAKQLLQAYWDRWEIEVNHRDEKTVLGVGQAQVRNQKSVPRQPALVVAAYSALLLAGLDVYGPTRTEAYRSLPKWRHKPRPRPSCLDLVTLLRQQWHARPRTATAHDATSSYEQMVLSAAA